MSRSSVAGVVCMLAGVALCGPALPADEPVTANVAVSGDIVAIFLPPSLQSAEDQAAIDARALVRSVMARARQCLRTSHADYALIFAERIVVRSGTRIDTFGGSDEGLRFGALLAQPRSNPRVIYVTGPEVLRDTLPLAVEDYFGTRC